MKMRNSGLARIFHEPGQTLPVLVRDSLKTR
jgi:hypothetical protein